MLPRLGPCRSWDSKHVSMHAFEEGPVPLVQVHGALLVRHVAVCAPVRISAGSRGEEDARPGAEVRVAEAALVHRAARLTMQMAPKSRHQRRQYCYPTCLLLYTRAVALVTSPSHPTKQTTRGQAREPRGRGSPGGRLSDCRRHASSRSSRQQTTCADSSQPCQPACASGIGCGGAPAAILATPSPL